MTGYLPHLRELRSRLIKSLLFFITAIVGSYYFRQSLYDIAVLPLLTSGSLVNTQIIYTGLAEAFLSYLRLVLFVATGLSLPFFLYQLYQFLAPGLYQNERKVLLVILGLSVILFVLGGVFMFVVVIPQAWRFFMSFQSFSSSIPLILQVKLGEYLALMMQITLAFGLAFQLPIILIILVLLKVINTKQLIKNRRLAIVVNFIVAAILTPPDVISQIALAIPLVLLYEIAIIGCKLLKRHYD